MEGKGVESLNKLWQAQLVVFISHYVGEKRWQGAEEEDHRELKVGDLVDMYIYTYIYIYLRLDMLRIYVYKYLYNVCLFI